ncbi:hypothetical protein BTUL_0160g00170 [Botrytis tulipae]|uniref:Uncharacterized protein n=1 Tax=Botrytis tulipae TaxID=87230 RepID=A0A4Z1EDN3_9HELO|nr:hypothetical protein BTUL_0160g00170 [Botrytis tulipae]
MSSIDGTQADMKDQESSVSGLNIAILWSSAINEGRLDRDNIAPPSPYTLAHENHFRLRIALTIFLCTNDEAADTGVEKDWPC